MTRPDINGRRLVLYVAATFAVIAGDAWAADNLEEIEVPVPIDPPADIDLDARSDFRIADIVKYQYLVVTVKVTAGNVAPEEVYLIRGPKKANSMIDDLRVKALSGTSVAWEYATFDPRFISLQSGSALKPGHKWEVAESARTKIYVPLSPRVTEVVIEPSPGSRPDVSAGGRFNPRPLAQRACRNSDVTQFPACAAIIDPSIGVVVP